MVSYNNTCGEALSQISLNSIDSNLENFKGALIQKKEVVSITDTTPCKIILTIIYSVIILVIYA